MTTTTKAPAAQEQRDALGERLFGSPLGGMELLAVEVGLRLGLYQALRDSGPASPGELGARTGTDERYAREWMEQQGRGAARGGRGQRGPSRAPVRTAGRSRRGAAGARQPGYVAATAPSLVGLAKLIDEVADAYRSGQGVAYARYGAEIRDGTAEFNRPMFSNDLASQWIAVLPDVHERLQAGEAVKVLDVGCSAGWSSIALAQGWAGVTVAGVDLDEASIADARRNAAEAGVADRAPVRDLGQRNPRRRGRLRPGVHLQGAARHGRSRGCAAAGPAGAARRCPAAGRKRARRRGVHRA